ncbi:MAG TPA: Fur family transcriptional regulator [Candidatus Baltobacteraceae bacterium]|jgi:Fe2+ or Zn2+ uptake regulation protein|nr:Fur family transcriptional regulator [Candidatus Baltobacteraceae bacterium]
MVSPTSVEVLTKNHRLVYDILVEHGTGTHLTMGQLHELALKRRPGIGFTTVYRGLTRLRDLGLVSEIVIPGADSAVYEPASHPHAHFRCTQCGRVDDVHYTLPAATTAHLSADNGFHVESIELSLHGRCRDCSKR